jgi:hypothetical protein
MLPPFTPSTRAAAGNVEVGVQLKAQTEAQQPKEPQSGGLQLT